MFGRVPSRFGKLESVRVVKVLTGKVPSRHKMAAGQLRRRLTMLVGIAILYAVAMAVEVAARKVSDIRPTIEEAQEHANQLAQMLAKLKSNLVVSVTDDL
ncbi:hypothetical protein MTO96_034885 [Rhipicephalus appendiculatus]